MESVLHRLRLAAGLSRLIVHQGSAEPRPRRRRRSGRCSKASRHCQDGALWSKRSSAAALIQISLTYVLLHILVRYVSGRHKQSSRLPFRVGSEAARLYPRAGVMGGQPAHSGPTAGGFRRPALSTAVRTNAPDSASTRPGPGEPLRHPAKPMEADWARGNGREAVPTTPDPG